jgi:hypothetical protein
MYLFKTGYLYFTCDPQFVFSLKLLVFLLLACWEKLHAQVFVKANMLIITVSEWLFVSSNSTIFQQYYGKNKLIFNEMKSALY